MTAHLVPRRASGATPAAPGRAAADVSATGNPSVPTRKDAPGTTAPRGRLDGLDAARGLALLGMIIVNVGPLNVTSLAHRLYLLPYGRASIAFVVVAGVAMGYLLASRPDRRPWRLVGWRAAVLLLLGFTLQRLTDDIGVILPLYALLFLLAPLLQRLPTRALLVATAVSLVVGPALLVLHAWWEPLPHATGPVQASLDGWTTLHGLVLSGRYPLLTWVVPFAVGLLVARADLRDPAVARRLAVAGGVTAVVAALASAVAISLLGARGDTGPARLLTGAAHGQMPLWLLGASGGAVCVLAVLVQVGLGPRARLLVPLVAVGRLSLTLYVAHVLVLVVIRPDGGFTLPQGIGTSSAMVVAAVLLALAWRRVGGPGPVERLLRVPRRRERRAAPVAGPTT